MSAIRKLSMMSRVTVSVAALIVLSAGLGTATNFSLIAKSTPDTAPPAIVVTAPVAGRAYNAAGWSAGCTPTAGICGTASDPSGVTQVRVAVRQTSTATYWDPGTSSFSSSTEVFTVATGTTSWRLPLPFPATQGQYTADVRATDGLGNATTASAQKTVAFTTDTTPPPAPVITDKPDDPTLSAGAKFSWTEADATAVFQCSLDGSPFTACGKNTEYKKLELGDHCFSVRAVDQAGNLSPQAAYCWVVATNKTFVLSGSTLQSFSPGAALPVNVTIGNPFNFPIEVIAIDVNVLDGTTTSTNQPNPDCLGTENLQPVQGLTGSVVVPANSTRSLQSLSVPQAQWPVLEMIDLPTNQDGCRATTFAFTFSGMATKP